MKGERRGNAIPADCKYTVWAGRKAKCHCWRLACWGTVLFPLQNKRGITRPPLIWNGRMTPGRAHGVRNRPRLTSLGNRIAVYGSGARARSIVAPMSLRFNGSSEYTRLAIRAHSGTFLGRGSSRPYTRKGSIRPACDTAIGFGISVAP